MLSKGEVIKNINGYHKILRKFLNHAAFKEKQKIDLNVVINDAEKVVGYPTSFLNLRFLLSDEFANLAFNLRKLIGTSHPLIQTTRNIIMLNEKPTYSLIVLLMSKAAGFKNKFPEVDIDTAAGILHTQRSLAEVCEMLKMSNLIHRSLVNFGQNEEDALDMNYGNKIALLCGDYILSNSYHALAIIRNQELNEIMSSALRDLTESDFFGPRDMQNAPLPGKPVAGGDSENSCPISELAGLEPLKVKNILGTGRAEWTLRAVLSGGSLLGKSCKGALKLGGHCEKEQEKAYIFGSNLALAWQAQKDKDLFVKNNTGNFSLVCAPVLLHLQYNPDLYGEIEKGFDSVKNINYDFIRKEILKGSALEETQKIQKEHSEYALNVLRQFPDSDARLALTNIINSFDNSCD